MITCPSCTSGNIKKNGHIHNGKQRYRCKDCQRQFVVAPTQRLISEPQKELINKLLLERISLAGICRTMQVSEAWLQEYIGDLYASQPDDLCADIPDGEAIQAHIADKFDEYAYKIAALKKTLYRLSLTYHGKILRHLTLS